MEKNMFGTAQWDVYCLGDGMMFVFFSSEIGPVALWFVPARDNPDNPDNTWGSDE